MTEKSYVTSIFKMTRVLCPQTVQQWGYTIRRVSVKGTVLSRGVLGGTGTKLGVTHDVGLGKA